MTADTASPIRFFQVAGYILAGGDSSRMGTDKGSLEIGGVPLVVRIAQLMGPMVSKRAGVSVIAPAGRYDKTGLPGVQDDRPGLGPLGGITTAVRLSVCPWALVIGCDMPYLTPEWLAYLMGHAVASSADIVVPESANGPEPLCAMYHKRCEPFFATALANGTRKITDAFVGRDVEMIECGQWQPFDPHGLLFKSINAPADFEEAKARLGGAPAA